MSNRCGPVESVFKNDRSIHWTRCPLCLFFFGSQRWPFSTLIGERIWTSRGQLWVNMVNASFLKFRVCTKWRQGDVCTKFRQVRTLFFGDMLSPASIPQRPYTECQPQRGQWRSVAVMAMMSLHVGPTTQNSKTWHWWVMGATLWSHSRCHLRCGKLLRWKSISFVR